MAVDSDKVLVEGFLDVKAPRGSNERTLMKVWRRLWVNFSVTQPIGRREPQLVLRFSKNSKDIPEKQARATRDGLRLFRCRSSSRPFRTWAIASSHSLLMYLASENEADAQRWMHIIRDGLWPPILSAQIKDAQHEVSLIDDERSFAIGILGTYGRLTCTTGDVISLLHPHWGGVLMRWQVEIIHDIRLVRKVGEKSGVFNIHTKSEGDNESRTLQFYSDYVESTISWIQSLLMHNNSGTYMKMREITKKSIMNNKTGTVSLVSSDIPEYSTVKKNIVFEDSSDEMLLHLRINSEGTSYGKINRTIKNLKDIPDDFLDASISSTQLCNKIDSEDSSSDDEVCKNSNWTEIEDLEEHVYEEINLGHSPIQRTESVGGITLYENIDVSDDEYVPPLPPEVPKRPATNLVNQQKNERLHTLSESVMVALKQAENMLSSTPQISRKNIVNKAVRKCKSLHVSPVQQKGNEKIAACKVSSERRKSVPNTKV